MASTKDRQRALERARYERVQDKIRKKERETKRRRRVAIVGGAVAVVVIAGAVFGIVAATSNSPSKTTAATVPTSKPSAASTSNANQCTAASSATAETTGYRKCGTAAKNVGMPTFTAAGATTYTATIQTNRGTVVFTADGKHAPYTVESFVYLANKDYFNNTPCHRLTTSGLYVLQCGDPTGTGSGGPGYAFQDENLASLGGGASGTYKAGTVAMANSGPGTNGSQFFLVYKDSPLPPNYTPFGTITQGMDVLNAIAAKGSNNSNGSGDGAPNEQVEIQKVTISQG